MLLTAYVFARTERWPRFADSAVGRGGKLARPIDVVIVARTAHILTSDTPGSRGASLSATDARSSVTIWTAAHHKTVELLRHFNENKL